MQAQVSYQNVKLLPKDLGKGKVSCMDIHYNKCMYSALASYMDEACGCRTPWIIDSELPICTETDAINKTYWIQWTRSTNQYQDCPSPCKRMDIVLSGKNVYENGKDYNEMYLYFPMTATYTKELELYTGTQSPSCLLYH